MTGPVREDEDSGTSGDPTRAHVRVLGTRLGKFVEFEYSLGDGDLAVELILPPAAFEEFCRARSAVVSTLDASTAESVEQAAWRAGQPGLLQRTSYATNRRDDDGEAARPGATTGSSGGKP